MKNVLKVKAIQKIAGIIAIVTVIGFAAACSNGSTGGGGVPTNTPISTTYEYVTYDGEENEYRLVVITTTGRAVIGGTYTLTITFADGRPPVTSTGTARINTEEDTKITLVHSSGVEIVVNVPSISGDSSTNTNNGFSFADEVTVIPVNGERVEPVARPAGLYALNIDGTGYVIISGVVKDGKAVIPDTFRRLPVIGIGGGAFAGNKDLKSVTIPANIMSIERWGAFADCVNLTIVTFAQGSKLEIIGGGAFLNCTSLTAITIPASMTSIGTLLDDWGAFDNCKNLKTVTFDAGSQLKTIGMGAFARCESLTKIEIPAGVTSIGSMAFAFCASLASVTIPASMTSIGTLLDDDWGAFAECKNLKTVTFAAGSQLKTIGIGTFFECESLTSITIPEGVTTIGRQAFEGSGITSITIPVGVRTIEVCVFYECQLTGVTIPNGVTSIGDVAFQGNKLTNVIIPNSVKTIGDRAFYYNPLTSVTIGAGVSLSTGGTGWASIPDGFDDVYDNGGKQAGTYTRADADSSWSKN